jgi:hypothetical protein
LRQIVLYEECDEAEETNEQVQVTNLVNPDFSTPTDKIEAWVGERIQNVSKPMSQTFLGIPHTHLSKKVPINMGPKVNRFRDIHCCVEIREML